MRLAAGTRLGPAAGLKLAEALRIGMDVADALDTAHRHHVVQQISTDSGMQALWRRDSRELFYLSSRGHLMAVEIRGGGTTTLEAGAPRVLFQTALNHSPQLREYAVTPDGQRSLVADPVGGKSQAITLLLNWRPPAR